MEKKIYGIGDLSGEVARRTGYPKKEVHRIIQTIILVIKDLLYHQCTVNLIHFCTFSTKIFKPRIINLPNGQKFFSPRRLSPAFKYRYSFKKQISGIKLEDTYTMTKEIEDELYLG